MRVKSILLAVLFMLGIGSMSLWAETPAELAKKAADEAAAAASQAAVYADQGLQQVLALDKAIKEKEAAIAELEKGTDAAALNAAQEELARMKDRKAQADKLLAKLNAAATEAQTTADAALDAAKRASAEGVSEADAQAAAGQAIRQARKAEKASRVAGKQLDFLIQWIKEGGLLPSVAVSDTVNTPTTVTTTTTTTSTTTTSTTIPRPGRTPTNVGRGRRGSL